MEAYTGLLSEAECIQVIDILQAAYNQYDIYFIWDKNLQVYNSSNDDLYHAININVSPPVNSGGNALTSPSTVISIDKGVLFGPSIVHEIGHCLGLLHVHNSADDDVTGKQITNTCEELVVPNSSEDCIKCGDCLCETKPLNSAPNVILDENGECEFVVGDKDSEGNEYQEDEDTWKNWMSYSYGVGWVYDCRERFVPAQINRMKNIIKGSGYLDRVRVYSSFEDIPSTHDLICLNIDNDITINSDIQIEKISNPNPLGSNEIAIFGDYEISVEQNTLVEIFEMNIYNPLDNNWKGFKVNGIPNQDDDTGLHIVNSSIIGAKVGIAQDDVHLGGYILANSVFFLECGTGIEMKEFSGDESIITFCDFYDGDFGIKTTNNNISTSQCAFANMDVAGIRGIGSSISVEGHGGYVNDFSNCKYGIRLSWPNGQSKSTDISDNVFDDNTYDVHVTGGSSVSLENRTNFINNSGANSKISFMGRGENNFTIQRNTFSSNSFCNFISNSGEEENIIRLNQFSNSNFGDVLTSDNLLTFFSANCYDNQSIADVYVSGTLPDQGTSTTAPGNCFSNVQGVEELRTSSNTNSFLYYVPLLGINGYQSCHLVNSTGNFGIETATGVIDNGNCGVSLPYPIPPVGAAGNSPCNPNKNEKDLNQAISDINDLIEEISTNTLLSQETKDNLIEYYERCLRRVKLWLVKQLVANGNQNRALELLRNGPSFYMQIKGYNLLVHQEDYIAADLYLNNLNPTRNEEQNYVYAQNIYLDHLNNKNYIPSASTLATLQQYGNVDNVLSGSIRAIYEYFTDIFIELDVTIDGYNPIKPRQSGIQDKAVEISIYPNPTNTEEELTIEIANHPNSENGKLNVTILDIHGQFLISEILNNTMQHVDISSLSSGMHIVIIKNSEGETIKLEKLIVL